MAVETQVGRVCPAEGRPAGYPAGKTTVVLAQVETDSTGYIAEEQVAANQNLAAAAAAEELELGFPFTRPPEQYEQVQLLGHAAVLPLQLQHQEFRVHQPQ